MKIIRHSTFETNSSSAHAIALNRGDWILDLPIPNKDGNIIIKGDKIFDGKEKITDVETKLMFVFVYFFHGKDEYADLQDYKSRYPWKDSEVWILDQIEIWLKEQTKCEEVVFDFSTLTGEIEWGGTGWEHFPELSNVNQLWDFLFNKNSILFIGREGTWDEDPDYPSYCENEEEDWKWDWETDSIKYR